MKKFTLLPITTLLVAVLLSGCAQTAKIRKPVAAAPVSQVIEKAPDSFTVGERLTLVVSWKGIPVGRATATVHSIIPYKEYEVYRIVVVARTNNVLSKLFRVENTFISYIDTKTLTSRRYRAKRSEGRYKKDLIVEYDFDKKLAHYTNHRDGTVKSCAITDNVQDSVSAAYYMRTIPLAVGDTVELPINLNEKTYELSGHIEKRVSVEIEKMGTFDAFLLKPYVVLEGKPLGKAKSWGYISSDKNRYLLYVYMKILDIPFVGEVTATLESVEYLPPEELEVLEGLEID